MLFESFLSFDNAVFQWIGNTLAPGVSAALDWCFNAVTMLGDGGWFFIALAVGLLIFKKTRKIGIIIALSLLLELLFVNLIMKPVFDRPRPYHLDIEWWVQAYQTVFPNGPVASHLPGDKSFPSGHTAIAFAGMAGLCFGALREKACKLRWLSLIGFVLAALVGFSRLYLGVHYPTDVLGGAVIGTLCALLAALIFHWLEPHIFRKKRIKSSEGTE